MLLLSELWRFLKVRRKFWLLPIIFINLALGGLLSAAPGGAMAAAMPHRQ